MFYCSIVPGSRFQVPGSISNFYFQISILTFSDTRYLFLSSDNLEIISARKPVRNNKVPNIIIVNDI